MRIRHLTALAATAVGAGLMLLGPAAQAAGYPPATASISVSATVLDAGQAVTVTGLGFQPLSAVTASWTGPGARGMVATVMPFGARALSADPSGSVVTNITFTASGQHVITLTGVDAAGAPVSLSASVTVRAAAPAELSHTGFPVLPYLLAALALLVLGVLIVMAVRRRRAGTAAAETAAPESLQTASH
jgi:hypothetical protein